jgi:vacuole morphology and inheritance protein 14
METVSDSLYRKYLADQNVDVRLATENVLGEFLREIKYIAQVQDKQAEADKARRETQSIQRRSSKQTMESAGTEGGDSALADDDEGTEANTEVGTNGAEEAHDWEGEGTGNWVPGQGVFVDHAAIMDIIIQHLSYPGK